jgi:hypothetical protein
MSNTIPIHCPTCGIIMEMITNDIRLKEEKRVTQCPQCNKFAEINIGFTDVTVTAVDEIELTVKGLREIADKIESREIELIRSRHGVVKISGRGKQRPQETDMFAIEVVYR